MVSDIIGRSMIPDATHEVVARGVEEITSPGRIEIEEDPRHDDDLLFQTRVKELEAVRNSIGKTRYCAKI